MDTAFTVHHVGYVVRNLDSSLAEFEILGFEKGRDFVDTIQDVKGALIHNGSFCVELLHPLSAKSPIHKQLLARREHPAHFCYKVDDYEYCAFLLRNAGFSLISEMKPAAAFPGCHVGFYYSAGMGVVEILREDFPCATLALNGDRHEP